MLLHRRIFCLLNRSQILSKALLKDYCTHKPEEPSQKKNFKREEQHEQFVKRALIATGSFENSSNKDKGTYIEMINIFENKDVHRRGHVEFIYAALKNMESYNVHKDLEVYKSLINVMPKGKFIPENFFQAEFMHYPKQQQCIIDVLEQMEDNGVIPDYEIENILINIFGRKGHPVRKFWRMMYWMPKFKNLSPWLLPNPVPDETLELAKIAVERMCSVDLQSKISVYETEKVESALDKTWIVSGQSAEQKELLGKHDLKSALHIEGPFVIWLRNKSINYFVLRGDPNPISREDDYEDIDDVSNIEVPFFAFGQHRNSKRKVSLLKSVHEQDDGTIFAISCTGSSTKDSLLSWIRLLEEDGNADLSKIPVLFKFRSAVPNQLTVYEKKPEDASDNR